MVEIIKGVEGSNGRMDKWYWCIVLVMGGWEREKGWRGEWGCG